MARLDTEILPKRKGYSLGLENLGSPGDYTTTRYTAGQAPQYVGRIIYSSPTMEFVSLSKGGKGVMEMSTPDYIKPIYHDIRQLLQNQNQLAQSTSDQIKEIRDDIKGLSKDLSEQIKNAINDAKDAFNYRLNSFEKSVDTRLETIGSQNKLIGSSTIAILITTVLGFGGLLVKLFFFP